MSTPDVRTALISDVVFKALNSRLSDIRIGLPAVVKSYDPATQLARIQPQIQLPVTQEDGTEVLESVPDIHNVPVMTLGGGGFFMSFPIAAGDTGYALFADRSIDTWKSVGGDVDPVDPRQHHLSDAVFIPGLRPHPSALPDASGSNAVFGKSGGPQVVITGSQIQVGGTDDAIAKASKVDALLNAIKTVLTTWTTVPNDGGAALKAFAIAQLVTGWPSDSGSTIAKVGS